MPIAPPRGTMRAMNRGAVPPLDVRDPGLPEALGRTENLVLWEMLRRMDRPVATTELMGAVAQPRAAVESALAAFERIGLVARRRSTRGSRGIGWVVTRQAIVVQYRVGDPEDQALLSRLDAAFDQKRRSEIAGRIKPEAARGDRDFSWSSMHAGSFNDAELKELWEMLQNLAHFLARAGERFKGAPAGTDHQCTHHVGVNVDPLLSGVLPLPNLQIVGAQVAATVAKRLANDWIQLLTAREAEIARGLARGTSRAALAEQLGISSHTVVEYTRRIYRKLGVSNRAQLSARIHAGAGA